MSAERFWLKVNRSGDCWLWTASTTKGYGQFVSNSTRYYAHRFSWLIHNGPIPAGMSVLHKCDTPLCVRPDHLFIGTAKDNVRDCIAKGRAVRRPSQGERNGSAKITAAQAAEIKRRFLAGEPAYKIAPDFGIGRSQAWNIGSGNSWRNGNGV